MNQIIMVLMDRDGFTYDEAMDALQDARQAVLEGDDPEQVLYEHFELEPDYVHELLWNDQTDPRLHSW